MICETYTEKLRKELVNDIETHAGQRAAIEKEYGQVWDTTELIRDYEVIGFLAPFVKVRRRSDNVTGTLIFQHCPRFYFNFREE